MGLGLVGAALGGMLEGGGAAVASIASDEIKNEAMKKRDEYLEKLREQSHQRNKQFDIDATDKQAAKERDRKTEIFADANRRAQEAAPGIINQASATYETDDGTQSAQSNMATVKKAPTDRDRAVALEAAASERGDADLVKEAIRQREQSRKEEADAVREANTSRGLAVKEREASAKEKLADAAMKRVEAIANKSAGGDEKATAEMRNITFYADNLFGGASVKDKESPEYRAALAEAAMFLKGNVDKPRDQRITEVAEKLKDDIDYATKSYSERIAAATKIVDRLRSENAPSRGGVRPADAPKPASAPAPGKPWLRPEFQKPGGK